MEEKNPNPKTIIGVVKYCIVSLPIHSFAVASESKSNETIRICHSFSRLCSIMSSVQLGTSKLVSEL